MCAKRQRHQQQKACVYNRKFKTIIKKRQSISDRKFNNQQQQNGLSVGNLCDCFGFKTWSKVNWIKNALY